MGGRERKGREGRKERERMNRGNDPKEYKRFLSCIGHRIDSLPYQVPTLDLYRLGSC